LQVIIYGKLRRHHPDVATTKITHQAGAFGHIHRINPPSMCVHFGTYITRNNVEHSNVTWTVATNHKVFPQFNWSTRVPEEKCNIMWQSVVHTIIREDHQRLYKLHEARSPVNTYLLTSPDSFFASWLFRCCYWLAPILLKPNMNGLPIFSHPVYQYLIKFFHSETW